MRKMFWIAVFVAALSYAHASPVAADATDDFVKGTVNWCIGNSTGADQVNCPDRYVGTYAECLGGGGRACLMGKAIASAKANDCANAFRMIQICQCHNGNAQTQVAAAGEAKFCAELKTR